MAFRPDGHSLTATAGADEITGYAAGVWDLAPLNDLRAHAVARACAISGGLTRQEWACYVPDLPYERTCQQGTAAARGR